MTQPYDGPGPRPTVGERAGDAVRGVLGLIGGVIRFVTSAFALVLVLHIGLTLFGANPANAAVQIVASLARVLSLGLADLFLLATPVLQLIVSYGVPALVWMAIGSVLVAILRTIGRPQSGLA